MSSVSARVTAFALVAVTALLVGFQGVSMVLTFTRFGADTVKPPAVPANVRPRPDVAVRPDTAVRPAEPVEPVAARPAEPNERAAVSNGAQNPTGIAAAAKAKAQAELDARDAAPDDDDAPPRERQRRVRSPRPDLHRVY